MNNYMANSCVAERSKNYHTDSKLSARPFGTLA